MNLKNAFERLGQPPVGFTSLVAAGLGGDLASVSGQAADGVPTLAAARRELDRLKVAQSDCTSDAAYWGYQGQVSYWQSAVNILEAAELTGPDSLPDVPAPVLAGVLMDQCAQLERFGAAVLAVAKATPPAPAEVKVKITGYRQLSEAEQALINEGKALGEQLGAYIAKLRGMDGLDQRWVSIGATDLQRGMMAVIRGIAQPTTF